MSALRAKKIYCFGTLVILLGSFLALSAKKDSKIDKKKIFFRNIFLPPMCGFRGSVTPPRSR